MDVALHVVAEPQSPEAEIAPSMTEGVASTTMPDSTDPAQVEMPIAASFTAWSGPVPAELGKAAMQLEKELGMPVLFLAQPLSGHPYPAMLDNEVFDLFREYRGTLEPGKKVALVLHSPGGLADVAYRIATLLRRQCGEFVAVVPSYAKSAATLLALGASEIRMAQDAELGPLDVQLLDHEKEQGLSGLDEVGSIDALSATALRMLDSTMLVLINRTGKKLDTLIPPACRFVSDFMRPLLEKVDAVHFTQTQRLLKVAKEYAERLLGSSYPADKVRSIPQALVMLYPDHGFVIDREEAERIGIKTAALPDEIYEQLKPFVDFAATAALIGRITMESHEALPAT